MEDPRGFVRAPDREMADTARGVLNEIGEEATVIEALLSRALHVAETLKPEETDVVVTRGGTALLLKSSGIKIPVAELSITGQDIAAAIDQARRLVSKDRLRLGMVTFRNMMADLEPFVPFLRPRGCSAGTRCRLRSRWRSGRHEACPVLVFAHCSATCDRILRPAKVDDATVEVISAMPLTRYSERGFACCCLNSTKARTSFRSDSDMPPSRSEMARATEDSCPQAGRALRGRSVQPKR